MAHRGSFWMYDAEAVAAVEAAGLQIAAGKDIYLMGGLVHTRIDQPVTAPLYARQEGAGAIFIGQKSITDKFIIDEGGNIPTVGTVDGVKISGLKIVSINPGEFVSTAETTDYSLTPEYLMSGGDLTILDFYAPVSLPDGVTVTRVTLYGYRDDELAEMFLKLYRNDRAGSSLLMGEVIAGWTSGWSSGYDDTIDYATINNGNYSYVLHLKLNPNDSVSDVQFSGAKIELA